MASAGYHILLDLYGVDSKLLDSPSELMSILREACEQSGMRIIKGDFHKFSPHGVTAFYILAESHISIHTWPEEKKATVDIYYCGDAEVVKKAAYFLLDKLSPTHVKRVELDRL